MSIDILSLPAAEILFMDEGNLALTLSNLVPLGRSLDREELGRVESGRKNKKKHLLEVQLSASKEFDDQKKVFVPKDPLNLEPIEVYTGLMDLSFGLGSLKKPLKENYKIASGKKLRRKMYEEGFDFNGIHYVRYKRSAGSAREGKCLFIAEDLAETMRQWSFCNLDPLSHEVQDNRVSFEAYIALTLSEIVGTVRIDPKNILVVKDISSPVFGEKAMAVSQQDGCLSVQEIDLEEKDGVRNLIWDGEGLLDESVFERAGFSKKGMMLLRNRFFKCCCFQTKLKKFFQDEMLRNPNIRSPKDLNGFTLAKSIEDIEMVVTYSSLKYMKFCPKGFSDEEWIAKWMGLVDSFFGIVKTDERSRFFDGRMIPATYQVLNTLDLKDDEVDGLLSPNLAFAADIRHKSETFGLYQSFLKSGPKGTDLSLRAFLGLKEPAGFSSSSSSGELSPYFKEDLMMRLLRINRDFFKTKLYGQIVADKLAASFSDRYKKGKIFIHGHYCTLFGNGYELLLHTVHRFHGESESLQRGEVYCPDPLFAVGEPLCGARNPHITMGNLLYALNTRYPCYDSEDSACYFKLSPDIVVVNSIHENILNRLNGSDYDSDTILLSNDVALLSAAKRSFDRFAVPVSLLGSSTKKVCEIWDADDRIGGSQKRIGEIVNLSQLANSLCWESLGEGEREQARFYYEQASILAILSGLEIDSAKKEPPIKISDALRQVKSKLSVEACPLFFACVGIVDSEKDRDGGKPLRPYPHVPMEKVCAYITSHPDPNRNKYPVKLSDLVLPERTGGSSLASAERFLGYLEQDYKRVTYAKAQEGNNDALRETMERYALKYEKCFHARNFVSAVLKKILQRVGEKDAKLPSSHMLALYLLFAVEEEVVKEFLKPGKADPMLFPCPNYFLPSVTYFGFPYLTAAIVTP